MIKRINENAQKVAYLAKSYPEKSVGEILTMLSMPAIDINASVWVAEDQGLIKINKKTQKMTVEKEPAAWELGETVAELKEVILYLFTKINEKEMDMEENGLGDWTQGYLAHDVLIAVKQLLAENKLAEYAIENSQKGAIDTGTYIFYTLPENKQKQWGRKQFENDPLKEDEKEESK